MIEPISRPCKLLSFLAAICILLLPVVADGQSNIEVFGQNRIQKRSFKWKYFDTKHFRVYHYDRDGRQLGRYVAEEAEYDKTIIEKRVGGRFPQRFNIILYNSYDEYRQSNLGLKDESPTLGNTKAGSIKIVDDKLVVYFTGVHADIRHQIRTGMALVVIQRMLYGDNLKEKVKNSLLLNLPQWVTDGYISYLVDGWDQKSNSEWKGVLDANPHKGFYELAEQNPELAGKAFWKFVANQYGFGTVKTLLNGMQQKAGINKAMKEMSGLNMNVVRAYDSCIGYYKNVYASDERNQELPDSTNGIIALKIPKDNSVIKNIRVSPKGTDICYVAWKNGEYAVCLQKTGGNQDVAILQEGGKKDLTEPMDPTYPMVAWSGTGSKLAILYRQGKSIKLKIYNNNRGRIEQHIIPTNRFDRVLSMTFMPDDEDLVFSAIKNTQTDLFRFTIRGSKMTNITDDVWDDITPEFISGGSRTGILFLSNRPRPNMDVPVGVNELPAGPLNVFFYNTKSGSNELIQCSDVQTGHITQPVQYGLDNFAFLHDSNGINNKFVVKFARDVNNEDSAYALPVTNYSTSILSHQYSVSTGNTADVVQRKDKYMVYLHELYLPDADNPPKALKPTILSVERDLNAIEKQTKNIPGSSPTPAASPAPVPEPTKWVDEPAPPPPPPIIKGGNAFQSEFSDNEIQPKSKPRSIRNSMDEDADENSVDQADSSMLTEINDSAYLKMKPSKYRSSFKPDFLSVKIDNSVLFNQYQSIESNGGIYANPPVMALTNISLNEVMEDQRITAGFQFPLNSSFATYFLQYQNFKHRLDWGIFGMRRQDKGYKNVAYVDNNNNVVLVKQQLFKSITNMIQADFSYPLDKRKSLRFHSAVREDKFVQKAIDTLSLILDFKNTEKYTSVSRFEFVFDNTIAPEINILFGTRYKIYAEYFYGLNKGNKSCYNIGLDVRNYKKIYKNFILANRLAYAHSDGNSVVQYLLGGIDNWVLPREKGSPQSAPDPIYGFQMLATSLRGYKQYARTGNNFAVFSTELRLPIVSTFVKRPVQSAMLKNLQAVAFVDAGTAWRGFLPTEENRSTKYSYPALPNSSNYVFLDITQPVNPAIGFGGGLRTSLFGYFLRLDAAWNVGGSKDPIVYLALGTDF